MGEQTHTQQILPEPDSKSQPETHKIESPAEPNALILHPTPPTSAVPEISHNPSKIPIRPPKIRKLSSPTPIPDANPSFSSSSSVTLTTTATPTAKNRRRSASQSARALPPQIIKPLSINNEIEFALSHLRTADPSLIPLIDSHPPPHFENQDPSFVALAKSILYQQLSYKAGTAIYTRFISLFGGEELVRPNSVLALSSQQLKEIGVSGRKASYLYDLANKYDSGILSDDKIVKMDDRSLFTLLSMVKGIGSWSVHMFMIFSLHRPDVLPVSDLGVRKGVQLLYGLEDLPRPSQMEHLCEKWRPYRSVGAWYMWRFVEGKEGGSEGNAVEPLQRIEQQHQMQFMEPVNGIGNLG